MRLARHDVPFFVYNFQSQSILTRCSSVVARCVVQSSAEVKDVDENTLKVLVSYSYASSPPQVRTLLWDDIKWEVVPRKRDRSPLTDEEKQEKKEHKAALKTYQTSSARAAVGLHWLRPRRLHLRDAKRMGGGAHCHCFA